MADKKLESLGFVKTKEKEHSAFYKKDVEIFNYIHCIEIYFKYKSGDLIISYEDNTDGKYKILNKNNKELYFSIAVELRFQEYFWVYVKLIGMRWKYDWNLQREKEVK